MARSDIVFFQFPDYTFACGFACEMEHTFHTSAPISDRASDDPEVAVVKVTIPAQGRGLREIEGDMQVTANVYGGEKLDAPPLVF